MILSSPSTSTHQWPCAQVRLVPKQHRSLSKSGPRISRTPLSKKFLPQQLDKPCISGRGWKCRGKYSAQIPPQASHGLMRWRGLFHMQTLLIIKTRLVLLALFCLRRKITSGLPWTVFMDILPAGLLARLQKVCHKLWNSCNIMYENLRTLQDIFSQIHKSITLDSDLTHTFHKRSINRPYFSRPRKYRRLFSEPTYWPRRSRGQYGEGNNEAGIFEAEGKRVLSQEDLLAHHWLVLLPEKCETNASCLCVASATMQAQVVRRRPIRNGLIDFFPPAFVNSQIAQVDRPKILERMVFGSSPLFSGVFVTFFSFKLRTWKNSKSFRGEIMKKIPDFINRLWNVCGQMEVRALLTCGSGIMAGICLLFQGFFWKFIHLSFFHIRKT